ncbi:MAG: tetrahydromethanopterin S-methyltransferase subunit H [Candidatus Bathyarchaeia archaeon]
MFKFEKEQKIFDVAGVKVGGQPGQLPTVMIGSIFYHKHKIVKDERTGEFDKEGAEKLLKEEEEISKKIGNPRIVDVCSSFPEAFPKFLDFVASVIDGPFTIDGATAEVRMAGLKYVKEAGLSNRVVYNSITPHIKEDEIAAIKEANIKSAILLALNTKNPTVSGRLQVMDELIAVAQRAGIENMLVDAAVLDLPDPGPVSKAIYLIKEKYGLPCGAGTHNAVARWNDRRKLERDEYLLACSVANVFPIFAGANFILYGPIEHAKSAYFHCGLADAYVAYTAAQELRVRPQDKGHPLFKIFK